MKFGSVKFFKRLIITVLVVVVVLPTVLAITFGVLLGKQKQRADWLESVNWALLNNEVLPEEIKDTDELAKYFQNKPAEFAITPSFDYQIKYPYLYYDRPATAPTTDKVCYLTFDDGPSPVTMQVLKVLGDYDIKATFFVTGENSVNNADALLAASEAGHTIGVHTYSHVYTDIYQSVDAYLEDFEKMHSRVQELTGTAPGLFRFPGGSINAYNRDVYQELVAEMLRRGFTFYDWNVAADDAVAGGLSRQEIAQNVLNSVGDQERIVVLMHDRQENATTAAALPEIIEELRARGYRFEPLSPDVQPVTFFYQE